MSILDIKETAEFIKSKSTSIITILIFVIPATIFIVDQFYKERIETLKERLEQAQEATRKLEEKNTGYKDILLSEQTDIDWSTIKSGTK